MRFIPLLIIFSACLTISSDALARSASYTERRTGVKIVWKDEDLSQGAAQGLQISEVRKKDFKRLREVIVNELFLYPHEVIKKSLHTIYIVKEISQNNVQIGGQARSGSKAMYLRKSRKSSIKETFHHEMAHMLFYAYQFPHYLEWNAINPPEFKYAGSGLSAISSGAAQKRISPKDNLKEGFVSSYARSSMAEDFAELASYAFKNKRAYRQNTNKYKLLGKKSDILEKFYISISSKLRKYF